MEQTHKSGDKVGKSIRGALLKANARNLGSRNQIHPSYPRSV
jgi:hypothetical protein